jgi:hypothetical protein
MLPVPIWSDFAFEIPTDWQWPYLEPYNTLLGHRDRLRTTIFQAKE